MATTYSLKIADSSLSAISLTNTGATGIIGAQGGFGPTRIPSNLLLGGRIAETYVLDLKGSSHDNAATQIQAFVKMIKAAKDYHDAGVWQPAPVYIEAQTSGETNKRYAVVFTAVEMEIPDLFDTMFATNYLLENFKLTLIREHPWSSGVPHTEGTAITLGASDGPASPTKVAVANFRDDVDLTHIWVDDGGVFGSNLLTSNSFLLFPAAPAVNDAFYLWSTDNTPKMIVIPIATAGVFTATITLQYWNGSAWTALTLGDNYTIANDEGVPASLTAALKVAGNLIITVDPPSDIASTTVNSQAGYGFRMLVAASTSWTTVPATHATNDVYVQNKNYVEVPAASIKGDSYPKSIIRIHAPAGPDSGAESLALSRILIGAKSEHGGVSLASFEPFINLGNVDNPGGWTITNGTDASSVADQQAPGGQHCAISFSSSTDMGGRVIASAANLLDDYEGEYRLFLGMQQIGGAAGDCNLKARIFVGGSAVTDAHADTRERPTRGFDDGIEVLDLGLIRFPLTRRQYGDAVASTDIAVEIHAERTTGTSTLELYYIFLFPVAEGSVGIDDPVSDGTNGSSALRDGNVVDIDSGIIADRTVVYIDDGTNLVPHEEWARFNQPIQFQNLGVKTRLYFMLMTYSANGWDLEPLVASLGLGVWVEMFMHYSYNILRGSD